jgi:hypothetical protein
VERLQVVKTLAGGILENFVWMELRKHAAWSETQPEFFYWNKPVKITCAGLCR